MIESKSAIYMLTWQEPPPPPPHTHLKFLSGVAAQKICTFPHEFKTHWFPVLFMAVANQLSPPDEVFSNHNRAHGHLVLSRFHNNVATHNEVKDGLRVRVLVLKCDVPSLDQFCWVGHGRCAGPWQSIDIGPPGFPCASETQITMTLEVQLRCCLFFCLLHQHAYAVPLNCTRPVGIMSGTLRFPVWTGKISYTYAHYCFVCNIHTLIQTKQNKKFCFIFQVPLWPGN